MGLMMAYPFIRFIFGRALGYNVQLESVRGVNKYTTDLINKHRQTGNYKNGEATNFIDAFLQRIEESKDDPKSLYTEEQFLITVMDFFTAGAETTANWLLFAMLLMMTHPDKQEKMHKEIQEVIGARLPDIEDKDRMVYTQAVMNEIHRWSKIAISMGPRQAVKDIEYDGRIITKGTTVLGNIYPVFHDKAYWGDPQVFRPERFIGPDGQLTKTERMVQFGLGKRICFGEVLARESGFIYLTTLVQRYKLDLPDEYISKKPNLRLLEGITTCPEDFRVKLVKRV
jgi:cytochrome P450